MELNYLIEEFKPLINQVIINNNKYKNIFGIKLKFLII